MTCLICTRDARGFGHSDIRNGRRRHPTHWVFCSMRCQDLFHQRYQLWLKTHPAQEDRLMLNPNEYEREAMRQCLRNFGQAATDIGFTKPLGDYSEEEALQVIEAIVTGWTEAMAAHFEQVNTQLAQARRTF